MGANIDFEVMRHNLKKGKQPNKTDMMCSECKGRGVITRLTKVGPNMVQQSEQKCNPCTGTGLIFPTEFFDRKIQKYTKVIPKGIFEGQVIVIENQGNEVPVCFKDQYPGQERSDIIISIVEERTYEIKGHVYMRNVNKSPFNIKLDLQIQPHEAICGTYKNIPYINGESICIEIPSGAIFKNGERVIIIPKYGIPYYKQKNAIGDLYIVLNVVGSLNIPADNMQKIWNLLSGTDMKQIHTSILEEHGKGHIRGLHLEDFAKSKECKESEMNQRNFDRLQQQRDRQNEDGPQENGPPGCQQQ
jgi:DnaJ-class molecular chaperone